MLYSTVLLRGIKESKQAWSLHTLEEEKEGVSQTLPYLRFSSQDPLPFSLVCKTHLSRQNLKDMNVFSKNLTIVYCYIAGDQVHLGECLQAKWTLLRSNRSHSSANDLLVWSNFNWCECWESALTVIETFTHLWRNN